MLLHYLKILYYAVTCITYTCLDVVKSNLNHKVMGEFISTSSGLVGHHGRVLHFFYYKIMQ
jgi:hypothetical protein